MTTAKAATAKTGVSKEVVDGLTHDVLEPLINHAMEHGHLDEGYLAIARKPGIEIPWSTIVTLDAHWKRPGQKVDSKVRIGGGEAVDAKIEANLMTGRWVIHY